MNSGEPALSHGAVSKEYACYVGDLGLIPGLGRSPGGGHGNLLQYSCLENPHRKRSLVGCSPWGCKESDKTERLSTGLRYADLFILMNIFQEFSCLVKKKKQSTGLLSINTLRLLGKKK